MDGLFNNENNHLTLTFFGRMKQKPAELKFLKLSVKNESFASQIIFRRSDLQMKAVSPEASF